METDVVDDICIRNKVAAIVGGTIGGIVGVILLIAGGVFLYKTHKKMKQYKQFLDN